MKHQKAPNIIEILKDMKKFSLKTFGPGERNQGLVDHIKKELIEIEAKPHDLEEWIDVIILAFDAAWRNGYTAEETIYCLQKKIAKNKTRQWPDWREAEPGKAIEHIKTTTKQAKITPVKDPARAKALKRLLEQAEDLDW